MMDSRHREDVISVLTTHARARAVGAGDKYQCVCGATLPTNSRKSITNHQADMIDPILSEVLFTPVPECTCASLSNKTGHRCTIHPKARARTVDERFDFEHAWDLHYKNSKESLKE